MTVTPRDDVEGIFISPADRLVSAQQGTFYKLSEAAQILGVSSTTLRRLMRNDAVKAPSFQVRQRKMKVYLYTPEDLIELREYFAQQVPERRHRDPENPEGPPGR